MEKKCQAIRLLEERVIQKIAAGEVVERPVSIVKELVENSIDAGASRIHIQIANGGIDEIIVQDNGHGIPAEQIELALTRHATSKLSSAEELFSLHSLGFRGEALPSIASVSEFRIESATVDSHPLGFAMEVKAGKHSQLEEIAMSLGTRIAVRNLFCTTPARRKFLKKAQTEWSHILDFVSAMALYYQHIEWSLDKNGKSFFFSPAVAAAQSRLRDVLGEEMAHALYPFTRELPGLKLSGFFSHPDFSKKSNRNMFVYVNGRWVQDRLINHAIVQGYSSLLMTQKYPVVVFFLDIDPQQVDVNVHPSKKEVRFAQGNVIHSIIVETLRHELQKSPWVERMHDDVSESVTDEKLNEKAAFVEKNTIQLREPDFSLFQDEAVSSFASGQSSMRDSSTSCALTLQEEISFSPAVFSPVVFSEAKHTPLSRISYKSLRLIGQLFETYIVCEQGESLVLIDQHAAHERIGFEKLKAEFQNNNIAQQRFLHPPIIEFTAPEAEALKNALEELANYGIELEDFGGKSFALKALPELLQQCDIKKLLHDVLDTIHQELPSSSVEEKIDHILATMACHRQIRAHHKLHIEEMQALLQDLEGTPRSYHCPHGRPVMIELQSREIERLFKRVI